MTIAGRTFLLLAALVFGACAQEAPSSRLPNAGAAPIVTITTSEITLDGQVVDSAARIARDTSLETEVFALREALERRRARRAAIDLLVVRVEDSVVAKVIDRVVNSARSAGYHFVLARRQSDGWAVVEPPAVSAESVATAARNEPWPRLSLLIDDRGVWVGTSVVQEFHQIRKTGTGLDYAALAARLSERKANAIFSDRTDIEIAAEETTDFATLRRVVAVAAEQGFPNWRMLHPYELSAKPML